MKANFDSVKTQEVLKGIQKGDKAAWDLVVEVFYQPLYGYILSMTRRPETAEELVQDVFVNFWVKREQIQINTSLKAYLYKASRNHTLNFLKRQSFERNYHQELAQQPKQNLNATAQDFHYNELEKRLADAISALPDNCREIFEMSRFEDLTYKEISEMLDIPIRQVHYQISLALKALRNDLQEYVDIPLSTTIYWLSLPFIYRICEYCTNLLS